MASGNQKRGRRYGAGRPAPGRHFCAAGGVVRRGVHAGLSAGPQSVRCAAPRALGKQPSRQSQTARALRPQSQAASGDVALRQSADTPAPVSDWDFYHSAEPAKPAEPMPDAGPSQIALRCRARCVRLAAAVKPVRAMDSAPDRSIANRSSPPLDSAGRRRLAGRGAGAAD